MTQAIHDMWLEVARLENEAVRLQSLGEMEEAGMFWEMAAEMSAEAQTAERELTEWSRGWE